MILIIKSYVLHEFDSLVYKNIRNDKLSSILGTKTNNYKSTLFI